MMRVGKIAWNQVRQIISTAQGPEALHIKSDYDGPAQRLDLNRRKRLSADSVDVLSVGLKKGIPKPGIPEAKKRDLMNLCDSGQIPPTYHGLYSSMPVGREDEEEQEIV